MYGESLRANLYKLSIAAALYQVWIERNSRIFGIRAAVTQGITAIHTDVWAIISSWKSFPQTHKNVWLCNQWNISNRVLRAVCTNRCRGSWSTVVCCQEGMPFFDMYSGLFCFGYNIIHVPKEKNMIEIH